MEEDHYHQKHSNPNLLVLVLPEYIQFTNCCQNICYILQNCHHCNVYISQTEEEMQETIKYIIFEYIPSRGITKDRNESELLLSLTSSKLGFQVHLMKLQLHKLLLTYLYMPETSMPTKIIFTGSQTLMSFQLSFSTETTPHRPRTATITELIKFCSQVMQNSVSQIAGHNRGVDNNTYI